MRSVCLAVALPLAVVALVHAPARAESCMGDDKNVGKNVVKANATVVPKGDPRARDGAQRGLNWLSTAAQQWQKDHNCYGCHVQAVTMEAMTVGLSHQYTVKPKDLDAIVWGTTDISGGVHGAHGLTVGDAVYLPETSKAFGGAAFAHFDERVSNKLQKELVQTATELLAFQQPDGSVRESYVNPPVASGRVQTTTQALVAWRQAFARTADTRWLVPIRKADAWITGEAKRMSDGGGDLQDMDHALIAMVAAGAGSSDRLVKELSRLVEKRQNKDGGWSFQPEQESDAFMTGQALYALRNAGRADQDRAISGGSKWLLDHQRTDGGWSDGGFGKAEAMWAVLGLVSLDKVSIDVAGLTDGQHVEGAQLVKATAADNSGAGIKSLALLVDDVATKTVCAASIDASVDASKLTTGAHAIDLIATTKDGKESRRRLMVYAGDAYVQELGARFDGTKTVLGFRNIAPTGMNAKVRVRILDDKKHEVHSATMPATEGPMSADFAGKTGGRFTAEVALLDATGKARDTQEILFTHDTAEAQKAQFAEVAGAVNFADDGDSMANTQVELVDESGKVVQKATTTRSGQYRFQNVDGGKYKVRVKKSGFKDWEAKVDAKAAEEAQPAPAAMMAQ